jgi:DNA-binding Lrp family transcriptional regulator
LQLRWNLLPIDAVRTLAVADFREGETVRMGRRSLELDRYDVAILSALSVNTRLTTVELAQKVHLSRTAVSRRIAALKRMNVLNDAADVLNYESMGFKVRASVEISAPGQATNGIKPRLLMRPEVLSVAVIAGDGLLCLDVIAVDMDHLHSFINSVQENCDITTKVVFAEEKSQLTLVERMRRLGEESNSGLVRT